MTAVPLPNQTEIDRYAPQRRTLYGLIGPQQFNPSLLTQYIVPRGNNLDDGPQITAALLAKGVASLLPRGTFLIATPVDFPLDTPSRLLFNGATMVSTLVPTGGPGGYVQSVLRGLSTLDGATTTLNAQPAIGARTISVVASIAAGKTVILLDIAGNLAQTARVLSVAGAGPFTLTLDTTILYVFTVLATVVAAKHVARDISIEGPGTITGTGDRAMEMAPGVRVTISDINVTRASGSFQSLVLSMDTGSLDSHILRCSVDGGDTSAGAFAIESAVNCTVEDCDATHVGSGGANTGVYVPSGRSCAVINTRVQLSTRGCYLTESSATDTLGCVDCLVSGCEFDANATQGLLLAGGMEGVRIVDTSVRRNATNGIATTKGTASAPAVNIALTNVDASDNTGTGLVVGDGVTIDATNLITDANTTSGVDTDGAFAVRGWKVRRSNVSQALRVSTSGAGLAKRTWIGGGSEIKCTGTVAIVVVAMNNHLWIDGLQCDMDTTGIAVVDWQGGTGHLHVSNARSINGGTFGIYMGHAIACFLSIGDSCDFSSTGTPYTVDATARCNEGSGVANGGGLLVVSWTPLQARQTPTVCQTGGVATAFTVVSTPGTGFSIQGLAAATYGWEVK